MLQGTGTVPTQFASRCRIVQNSALLDLDPFDINESALMSTINFQPRSGHGLFNLIALDAWARATVGLPTRDAFQAEIRNVATQNGPAPPPL